MAQVEALFIDSAGVLVDANEALPRIWRRRIGEFCVPRLGGTLERWAEANRIAFQRYFDRYREASRVAAGLGARSFYRWADGLWMAEMCERVGVAAPADAIAFADECIRYVATGSGEAAYPDAAAGVRALAERVPRLFTATSQDARQIDGYLRALGLRELFEKTYGGDLVDRFKVNAAFFAAIMADAGVRPMRAAIVDDSPKYLGWAREAGMKTFLLGRRAEDPDGHEPVPSLAYLAQRLA